MRMEFYGTFGESCHTVETLEALLDCGMTGIRLNLSHLSLRQAGPWLEALQQARERTGRDCQLLVDLQGPELRIGALAQPLMLEEGQDVVLISESAMAMESDSGDGRHSVICVPDPVSGHLEPEQEILLDDGLIRLRVTRVERDVVHCLVQQGGTLGSRKSLSLPGIEIDLPTLCRQDLENMTLFAQCGVDAVMLPFVRGGHDVKNLRQTLDQRGCSQVRIFSKIENRQGIHALDEILPDSDMIVIARGDLGLNMPLWELPAWQERIAGRCREAAKPFMVVTQMLHSMQETPVPTRAEVSDIYQAVRQGAQALMLTGETAAGRYPVEAMTYLVKTAGYKIGDESY